tara:strand:+ start:71 stop:208 length:138 start_codon:yes stop_codon:yes gene_type:complete
MITKTKLWSTIIEEMRAKRRLDKLTETIMKKIEELEVSDVERTNK